MRVGALVDASDGAQSSDVLRNRLDTELIAVRVQEEPAGIGTKSVLSYEPVN
jgi:hypothetical protein